MPPLEPLAWTFDAIGTQWQIDTDVPLGTVIRSEITDRIEAFDQVWSRFRADSLVTAIATSAGTWTLPSEAEEMLGLYAVLYELTEGAMTPLIGQRLADLGYDAGYSLVTAAEPAGVPPWDAVQWDPPNLTVTVPVLLDVGAAGKGCLVDLVAGILAGHGFASFTVDGSGDLVHHGGEPLRVALEHPLDPTRAVGVAELPPGRALAASATNRRAWGNGLHHVLDGRTGQPTSDVIATWTIADSCLVADALATAQFLAEPAVLMSRYDHDYVRMHADGHLEWSTTFPGEVFA